MCLCVCTEGSRQPLNRYGSPLQCSFYWVLGKLIAFLGEGTITLQREITKKYQINSKKAPLYDLLVIPPPLSHLKASRGVAAI